MNKSIPECGANPLELHFRLKERGSNFSDIARRASRRGHKVSASNVRGVVYGYLKKNTVSIWRAIADVLKEPNPAAAIARQIVAFAPDRSGAAHKEEKRRAA